jgi:hypothetical protein
VHKLEPAPDDGTVRVEMPLPKQVTEDDNRLRVASLWIVRRDQSAAQKGRYPEMSARVTGELNGRHILGQVFVRGRQIPGPPARGHALDTLGLPQQFKLRPSDPNPPVVAAFVYHREVDHAVGALVGKGVCQQAVDYAEHGGRGADAQRERNDGSESEAGLLADLAEEEPKILQHLHLDAGAARRLLD